MKPLRFAPWLVLPLIVASIAVASPGSKPRIDNFTLDAIDGSKQQLRSEHSLTVICFLGTECPLAKLYGPRLQALHDEFSPEGVRFLGISSNLQDSVADLKEYVALCSLTFPMLKDHDNIVADQFGATRTPEVFLLDSNYQIRYQGRIDNQYSPGAARPEPTQHDLRDAIEQLLNGKQIARPKIDAVGCIIGRVHEPVTSSSITYAKHIARVLQRNCIECHRDGQIGPFSLTEYDEVIGWGEMMLEVIDDKRMPPWHANPEHGEFANARVMPDEDKRLLRDWVHAGMPFGDKSDLPEPTVYTEGWHLPREPDLVLPMSASPFVIPAEGTVEYQYFVVDPGFTEDKWVTMAEVMPGNPSVVHHSIVFIRPPDGQRFRGASWLTAYVPGQANPTFSPTRARKVPAGSKLVFQQHYTPTGTEQSDLTRVGILFGDPEEITHEAYTLIGLDQEFVIPPHEPNFVVQSQLPRIPDDAELLGVAPHMHLRGKSFRLTAKQSGQSKILLDVPQYDFNWQHVYQMKKPMPLSDIDSLDFTVTFDNSESNLVNPAPDEHVCWGDQTWEEMAVVFFEVSELIAKPDDEPAPNTTPITTAKTQGDMSSESNNSDDQQARIDAFVEKFFKRFDQNEDDVVTRSETPFAFQRYSFYLFDHDSNGKLDRAEVVKSAQTRIR